MRTNAIYIFRATGKIVKSFDIGRLIESKIASVRSILSLSLLLVATTSYGEDLLNVYEQALAYDLTFKQAQEDFAISEAGTVISRASLLPRLAATANHDHSYSASTVIATRFDPLLGREVSTSSEGSGRGRNQTFGLSLSQPLFDLSSWYAYKGQKLAQRSAVLSLSAAEQSLIIRVTRAYVGVLKGQAALASEDAQVEAATRQLGRAQRLFDVGEASATAVNEARTRLDQVKLRRLTAQNQLDIARESLAAITGQLPGNLAVLDESFAVESIPVGDIDAWLTSATDGNFDLARAALEVERTELQTKEEKFRYFPTARINASYDERDNNGDGLTTASENEGAAVLLQLTVPLYAGGSVRATKRQVLARHRQAEYRYQEIQRQIGEQTRNAIRNLNSGVLRVTTSRSLISSAEQALRSTRRGYEDGERTVLDLLDAERSLADAKRDFTNARYDYVVDALVLKQLVGTLRPADIADLNSSFSQQGEASSE